MGSVCTECGATIKPNRGFEIRVGDVYQDTYSSTLVCSIGCLTSAADILIAEIDYHGT